MNMKNKFMLAVIGVAGAAYVLSKAKEHFDIERIKADGREKISAAIKRLGDPAEHRAYIREKTAFAKDMGITFPVPGSDTVYIAPPSQTLH